MARAGADVAEPEPVQDLAHRALVINHAEALRDEALQVDSAPAHDAMYSPIRAALDEANQLGLLTPVAGLLVVGQMAGAFWFVHRGTEVMASAGGWELVGVIGFLALVLAATGAGRISLDALIGRRAAAG